MRGYNPPLLFVLTIAATLLLSGVARTQEPLKKEMYGFRGDDVYSHREFTRHHNLPSGFLSDHFHEVAKTYNSFNPLTGFNLRTIEVVDRPDSLQKEW